MLPVRRLPHRLAAAVPLCAVLLGPALARAQASTSPATPPPSGNATRPPATAPKAAPPVAGVTATSAAATGTESDADDTRAIVRDVPIPKPPESSRWLLLGVGAGTTALWWVGSVGIGELWPGADYRTQLRIPIAGPFIDLGHNGCPAADPSCSTFELVVRTILVSLDAIGQVGGVALMLQGATLSTASVEAPRSNLATRSSPPGRAPVALPVPWTDGKGSAGIGLVGRF